MDKIKVMDSSLSNMIAAGEVVERPANVVKELIENSIDAHATEIEISIKGAGRSQIKVKDNGVGMSSSDAQLAFLRHATSKISSKKDLFRIKTLGFRGEALPSIAAVSRVVLETAVKDNVGTRIVIENDEIIENTTCSARTGTTIEVTKIFYNTPVRLKFLKSEATEFSNILDVVTKQALANPGVRFELISEGKRVFNSSGRGDLLEVIKDVYGLEVAKNMLPIHLIDNDFEISGYVGKFILSKSNRNYMVFIVNERNVKIPMLQNTVLDAYANYLTKGRYPMAILFIKTDPSLVDVNVHPSKSEIRLERNDKLIELIRKGIRKTLTDSYMVPDVSPTKRFATNEAQMTLDSRLTYEFKEADELQPLENKATADSTSPVTPIEETYQELGKKKEYQNIMSMRPIGQLHNTYILAESIDGFYIIDQHAAMERINFEKFSKTLMEIRDSIDLLVPCVVEFSLDVINIIKDKLSLLQEVGIDAELFGGNAIKVSRVPTWMQDVDISAYTQDLVEEIINNKEMNIFQLRSYAIASLSCKASLKANKALSILEMEYVISRLLSCDNPHSCPHGRPTMLFYSKYEIEKMFKRVG